MTWNPIRPLVHLNVTWIMHKKFGMTPERADAFATQFIGALLRRGFIIIRPSEMYRNKKEFKWEDLETLSDLLEAERNGIKPWNPPELTTSGTSGER